MYGTSDIVVRQLLEELPNADKCKQYKFVFRKGSQFHAKTKTVSKKHPQRL